MARRYPKSANGRFFVTLNRAFPALGLKPGAVDVTEAVLKDMLAEEDLVANVIPAA